MSVRKRFDRELYNQTDNAAKTKVFDILKANKKLNVQENIKKTGVDIVVTDPKTDEVLFNIECEIKKVWKTEDFPYDSVQFPERKAKFAKLDKPTLFVMFNNDQSSYLVVKSEDLLNSPVAEVPNKYVYKGEMFYQVPLTSVTFNDITKVVKEYLK